jgi:hypothetical protein
MLRVASIFTAGLTVAVMGCATRTPGIELAASDFDLNPLVGQWRGDYSSSQTGRSGTIAFTLRAGESAASGNVVMIPRADSLLTPAEREMVSNIDAPGRSVLSIHFVRKEAGNLSGTLDPYRDPECNCTVTTTFQGSFRDPGTIEGTYSTVPSTPGRSVTGGKWKVTRVKRL